MDVSRLDRRGERGARLCDWWGGERRGRMVTCVV